MSFARCSPRYGAEISYGGLGHYSVRIGASDIGTGNWTVLTQVAADALGLPFDKVHVEIGDTDLPMATVEGGSTITQQLVRNLCLRNPKRDLERKIIEAKLAIEYAERFATAHDEIDDAFFERLRAAFTDAEVLDLTLCISVYLGLGRTLAVLGVDQSCAIDI